MLSELGKFGFGGIVTAISIYGIYLVWKSDRSSLVDWRVEARTDLKEERTSRQAHEATMTKLMSELASSIADIKEALQIVLDELRKLQSSGK